MYIDRIELTNVRSFGKTQRIEFVHPDSKFQSSKTLVATNGKYLPRPRLKNVNLLLGDNGSGKTTVLRAIAAAAFGPAAKDILRDSSIVRIGKSDGWFLAQVKLHEQDDTDEESKTLVVGLDRMGERLDVTTRLDVQSDWIPKQNELFDESEYRHFWRKVYESENEAFFIVGYGATRRVEQLDKYDPGARSKLRPMRDQRVMSLFEDSFSLIPLASWLPQLKSRSHSHYEQIVKLLSSMIKPGRYEFIGKQDKRGDFLFQRGEMDIPFQSLSDGYRAFIGWVGDLLHHLYFGCLKGKDKGSELIDVHGIVLVDEIDLHLHPKWQMQVLETVSKTFPKLQFIVTSHSPLVASSLEWMNVFRLKTTGKENQTVAKRVRQTIHGLDADQILLTDLFGLTTTRAVTRHRQLEHLRQSATLGNTEAKRRYVRALASGSESTIADESESRREVAE